MVFLHLVQIRKILYTLHIQIMLITSYKHQLLGLEFQYKHEIHNVLEYTQIPAPWFRIFNTNM